MIYSTSTLIAANIDKVYATAEKYPKFVSFYSKKNILRSDETTSEVEVGSTFFGMQFNWRGIGKKIKNQSISWTQCEGLLKNMRAEWILTPKGHSTEVVIKVTYNSSTPLWAGIAAAVFIRPTVPKILNCLKCACENDSC